MGKVIQVTDKNFKDEVSGFQGPVMLEFYASWCPHCQKMTPIIKKLAEEYAGKIKFIAADIDQAPGAAAQYRIHGVPTMYFFKRMDGDPNSLSGEQDAKVLKEFLDELL